MSQENVIKIGELLVRADLLNTSDVLESIQVSQRLQIPIGRVLIMSGTVTQHLLQSALQAQLLIKEGLVTVEAACDALRLAVLERKTLQKAFEELNITPGYQQDISTHLVELLLDSNIVTQEQIDEALQTSTEADIPLSGALVLHGVLSTNFFPTILHAQEQISTGQVSREEAVSELKSSFLMWLKAEESLKAGSKDGFLTERIEDMKIADFLSTFHHVEDSDTEEDVVAVSEPSLPRAMYEWKVNQIKVGMMESVLNHMEKQGYQVQTIIPLSVISADSDGTEPQVQMLLAGKKRTRSHRLPVHRNAP